MAVKTKNPLLLVLFLHPVPKVAFGLPEPSDHFRSIFVVSSHYRRYVANSHYGRKGAEACLWSERRRRVRRRRRAVVRRRRIRNDHGRLHLHCRRAFPQHLMVDVVIYCLANEGKDSVDEAVMVQSAQEEKDGVLLKRGPSSPGATERSDPWRRRQHRRSGGVAGPVRIEIPYLRVQGPPKHVSVQSTCQIIPHSCLNPSRQFGIQTFVGSPQPQIFLQLLQLGNCWGGPFRLRCPMVILVPLVPPLVAGGVDAEDAKVRLRPRQSLALENFMARLACPCCRQGSFGASQLFLWRPPRPKIPALPVGVVVTVHGVVQETKLVEEG
ncbi:hypothetical protein IWX49DRAFT_583930 [Phyllosticta citricarpa]|uniref:Secreted protein n=2 Tax=Phyllosticta TaxID=121621 RepID=A0ABR1L9D6_9PEZI